MYECLSSGYNTTSQAGITLWLRFLRSISHQYSIFPACPSETLGSCVLGFSGIYIWIGKLVNENFHCFCSFTPAFISPKPTSIFIQWLLCAHEAGRWSWTRSIAPVDSFNSVLIKSCLNNMVTFSKAFSLKCWFMTTLIGSSKVGLASPV